jgi:hypothetical protein
MTTTESSRKATTVLSGRRDDIRGLRSRPRRGGLLAFAALMIVGSAVAVAVLVNRAGDTHEVLIARTEIPEGHTIQRDDLATARVSGVEGTYSVEQVNSLVGTTAVVGVVPRQVMTESMVSESPVPGEGESLVGLNLDPSRVPSAGLEPGDNVMVIAAAGGETGANPEELDVPTVLTSGASVFDLAGSATEGEGILITLRVAETDAAKIAAYSVAGRVAVVETSAGAGAGGS